MRRRHNYEDQAHPFEESEAFERIKSPRRQAQLAPLPAPDLPVEGEPSGPPELEPFFRKGWISEVLHEVKSGKEATVYCCRAHPDTGMDLFAAKVYRSRDDRNFKNDAVYQQGRVVPDQRLRRAVEHKTRKGREVQFAMWIAHEFQTLRTLYGAGAQVPVPFAAEGSALLLEYIGDDVFEPAPVLNNITLPREQVRPLWELLLHNIELWLSLGHVHADLSAFNILYRDGRLTVIDFPQAVDPQLNPHAFTLLTRDLSNLCRYWARYGVRADPQRLAGEIWARVGVI